MAAILTASNYVPGECFGCIHQDAYFHCKHGEKYIKTTEEDQCPVKSVEGLLEDIIDKKECADIGLIFVKDYNNRAYAILSPDDESVEYYDSLRDVYASFDLIKLYDVITNYCQTCGSVPKNKEAKLPPGLRE